MTQTMLLRILGMTLSALGWWLSGGLAWFGVLIATVLWLGDTIDDVMTP